jgi:peptidyl-dipeptidase Dcp
MNNPLLADFNTPFSNVPFEDIKEEHFLPALKEAIAMGLAEVESICIQEEAPTFKNTILALELVGEKVSKVAEVFLIRPKPTIPFKVLRGNSRLY